MKLKRIHLPGHGAIRKVLTLALLLLIGFLVVPSTASAHAVATDISPEPDAVLGRSPGRITIEFNEQVSATDAGIRVFDPAGSQVAGIEAEAEDKTLWAELPTLEDKGSYTVSWQVVSADGHAINGAYLFSIGKATLTEPLDVGAVSAPVVPRVVKVVGAVLSWLGLVAVLGALAMAIRVPLRRRLLRNSARLLTIGALISFLGALSAVNGSLTEAVRVTFSTDSGKAALGALALSALLTASAERVTRGADRITDGARRWLVALSLAVVVVMALEGHALALSPLAVSAFLTPLHVLAGLIWLAGLVWVENRSRTVSIDELAADVRRRSLSAMLAVAVLFGSGLALYMVRMPIDQLLTSAYGLLGAAKLVLLAMALPLAWQNRSIADRRSSTSEVADGSEPPLDGVLQVDHANAVALRRFRASLRAEIVILAVALILGAILAQTAPPGLGSEPGGYFGAKKPFGDGQVELTIDPGKRGVNEIHVTALGSDGRLMAGVDDLAISFLLPEKDLGPLDPKLQKITAGHSYTFARIPFSGDWKVKVTATRDRFEQLEATFEVPIGN